MSKLLSLAREAVRSGSGRWIRRDIVSKTVSRESILDYLNEQSDGISRLLAFAEAEGEQAMKRLESRLFQPFLDDVYFIGDPEVDKKPLGYVALPTREVLGRSFDSPVLVIRLDIGEDGFYIAVQRDGARGISHSTQWSKRAGQDWPSSDDLIRQLYERTEAVLRVLLTLKVPSWAALMAA